MSQDPSTNAEHIRLALNRLHRKIVCLHELWETAKSGIPRSAIGTDPTGAVEVTVDSTGMPNRIRVASDWRHGINPKDLSHAVTEAFISAIAAGLREWSRALERTSWSAQTHHLNEAEPSVGSAVPAVSAETPTRDIGVLTEDVLALLRDLRRPDRIQLPAEVGRDRTGRVTIVVSRHGLQECSVDPVWAARVAAHRLNTALDEALTAALGRLKPGPPQPAQELTQLATDALAALRHLSTPPPPI